VFVNCDMSFIDMRTCIALTGFWAYLPFHGLTILRLRLGNMSAPKWSFRKFWQEVCTSMYCNLCVQVMWTLAGLRVVEVAHDIQQQVSKYVTRLGLVNSFDTWHGTG